MKAFKFSITSFVFLILAYQYTMAANQIDQVDGVLTSCSTLTPTTSSVDCYKEKWSLNTFVIYSNYYDYKVTQQKEKYTASYPLFTTTPTPSSPDNGNNGSGGQSINNILS